MSIYLIPILILSLVAYSVFKKVNTYSTFVEGAIKSLKLVSSIFPYIVTIFIMVELFRISGLAITLSEFLAPMFGFVGVPKELIELVLLRPFTGSGSLALLSDIYVTYGTDSYIGRTASVIMGSSETVFYVSAVYFSKTSVKKLGYAIPIALVATLVGAIIACLVTKII
jgi:spore maturation protein B